MRPRHLLGLAIVLLLAGFLLCANAEGWSVVTVDGNGMHAQMLDSSRKRAIETLSYACTASGAIFLVVGAVMVTTFARPADPR